MLVTIIIAIVALLIGIGIGMEIDNSTAKTNLGMMKIQLDNLIKTYNDDTTDLNNKLQDALGRNHNLKLDLIKVKNELIETKKAFRVFKEKASTPAPTPVVVNKTDNDKHTEVKRRGRPKKN